RYISWCMDGFTQIEKQYLYEDFPYKYFNSEIELLNQKIINNTLSLDDFMMLDYKLNLPDCLLVKMDIATMAHGLEARSPFLDYRIAEWASGLNSNIKMKGFRTKPILRELAKQYLPKAIVFAPKRGFEIPLIKWLRNDLKEMVWDTCLDPNGIIKELFNKEYVENLLNEKINIDPGRWSKRVWILFMLAMWDKYIYREINK
ncbi:MAG: asparagine synthase-related protein, partial [Promethearchaeota archaeon]